MGCSGCKIELSSDELKLKIICDRCGAKFCQSCSGLGSTEIRCMPLRERKLKFFCGSCINVGDQHATLVEQILDSLKPLFDATFTKLKEATKSQISALSQQVADLAESNKDLIRLLDPTPAIRNTIQSDSLPHPKVGKPIAAPLPKKAPILHQSLNPRSRRSSANAAGEIKAAAVKNYVRGTAPTPEVAMGSDLNSFAAVARRAYLYIGNVNPGAGKETITNYIKKKVPGVDFVIDELPKREEALSRAFKLTVDFTLLETFNKSDFWPQGVIVKRFFQFKKRQQ